MKAANKLLDDLGFNEFDNFYDNFMAMNFGSDARYAIFQMQDLLRLGDEAKMNSPSTIGSPNWEWKMQDFKTFDEESSLYAYLIEKYNR